MTSLVPTAPVPTRADDDFIAVWLHGRPATTQLAYRQAVDEFTAHVGKQLLQTTLADIQSFQTSQGHHSPATQCKKLSAVKSLFSFAHKAGYIPFNPGVAVQMPRIKNTIAERILSEDDVRRMIEMEANRRNRMILRLLYMAGLRREELCNLRVRDMRRHGQGGKLTVFGKGGKTRTIPLPPAIWRDLAEFAPEDREAPLFGSARGALSVVTVWRVVKNAANKAGLSDKVSTHWMRHSHSTHALDHGCPVHVLQGILGHASLVTTSKYIHLNQTDSSADYLEG